MNDTAEERMEAMAEEQIERRCRRGLEEIVKVVNRGEHPVYSEFEVTSTSERRYRVQIRSLTELLNGCECPDYRTNTLGTCKHIEGVLQHLKDRNKRRWKSYIAEAPAVVLVSLDRGDETLVRINRPLAETGELAPILSRYFDAEGALQGRVTETLRTLVAEYRALPNELNGRLVIAPEVIEYLNEALDIESVARQKEWFLAQVKRENHSFDVTGAKLYPYQEEGVLHLAFGRRVVLADDMGLGKTVQAIAAAALLKRLRDISHVLIVAPASLKHQWAREIRRFTSLSVQVVEGNPIVRRQCYRDLKFFNIINYELIRHDEELLSQQFFELAVLDEAQRIKNWRTKTAEGVKRLRSRYAFVLTGTPLENRLDDLYSIFQFVDPHLLGPLWRYNQRFFEVERRPSGSYKVLGYKNLDELRKRIAPYVLRRTREHVLQDLPERIDNNYFVEMTGPQSTAYDEYEAKLARLVSKARRRPLTPAELKMLRAFLTKMRLICDALALHDGEIRPGDREKTSPKLAELRQILEEEVASNGQKALVFSQWTTMLDFCEPILKKQRIGFVKLTGDVPSAKRGALIDRFSDDPDCKVFLSSDAGGVGLNLQAAGIVINLDLPWNPAVLEQRIARAHRHGQRQSVQVINLIAKGTIEERMLDTLAAKRTVFRAALDPESEVEHLTLEELGQSVLQRLEVMLEERPVEADVQLAPAEGGAAGTQEPVEEADAPSMRRLTDMLLAAYPGRIVLVQEVAPAAGGAERPKVLVVVDRDPASVRDALPTPVTRELDRLGSPELVFMEQEGYRALCTLWGDTLQSSERGELYRAAQVAEAGEDGDAARVERLRKVEEGLKRAQKRLDLARVVMAGGFPEEVLRPLRESLGFALNAGLCIETDRQVTEELPSARSVESHLTSAGVLSAAEAAQIERMRVLTAPSDEEEPPPGAETLNGFLAAAQELIDRQRERVVSKRLK